MYRLSDIADLPADGPVYIFGASEGGQLVLTALERRGGFQIAGFIDNFLKQAPGDLPLFTTASFLETAPPGSAVAITSNQWATLADSFKGHDVQLFNANPVVSNILVMYGLQRSQADFHHGMMVKGAIMADWTKSYGVPETHPFGSTTPQNGEALAQSSAQKCLSSIHEIHRINAHLKGSELVNLKVWEIDCLATLGDHAKAAEVLFELIHTPWESSNEASPFRRSLPKRMLAELMHDHEETWIRQYIENHPQVFKEEDWRITVDLSFEKWVEECGSIPRIVVASTPLPYVIHIQNSDGHHKVPASLAQPELQVARGNNITVLDGLIPLSEKGHNLHDTCQFQFRMQAMPSVIAETKSRLMYRVPDGVNEVEDCCIFMGGHLQYRDNYWHFLLQQISRVSILLEMPEFAGLPVAFTGEPTRTQDAILTSLGLSPDRRIILSDAHSTRFREVILASPPGYERPTGARELQTLRRRITEHFGCSGQTPTRALYLSRNGRYRAPTHAQELERMAIELGFEVIDPGSHSFEEQVRIFASARAICGPHGASFTNMLFSPPGARIVTLGPKEIACNDMLTPAASLEHVFCFCHGSYIEDAIGHWNALNYDIDKTVAREAMLWALNAPNSVQES